MPSRRLFDGAQAELGILPIVGGAAPPTTQTVTQTARFDNVNTLYGGTVLTNGSQNAIYQSDRFDNAQVFYGGVVNGGDVTLGSGRYLFIRRRRRS